VIGPVGKSGAAPAAVAAALLVAGTFLGAWSVSGAATTIVLLVLCAGVLAPEALRQRRLVFGIAFTAFWIAAGFLSGQARIATRARQARETFATLPYDRDRAGRIEGVLSDFWGGAPPRAHGRLRAERIFVGGAWRLFPAEVLLFVSGEEPLERRAGRGDRVEIVGHLTAEGPPASDRDIQTPWPTYRLSVKSAWLIQRREATLESFLTAGNRWIYGRLPPLGSRGERFDRDVRGPLAALLLGRTADLDRGMVARYRRGGLYHLLVISGLHVALAVGLLLWLLRAAGIGGKRRDSLLLAGVAIFVLLGGANPPAVRAGLVFGVYLASRLLERPVRPLQAIGLSALLLLSAAPREIWSVGTVLTFAAVLGIAFFLEPIRAALPERPRSVFSSFAAALAAQAGTAPALLWRFNVVSAGAWLTAPLCVPLAAALIAVGAGLLLFFAAGIFPAPLALLFAAGSRALEFLAERASGIALLRPTPPLPLVLLVGAALLVAALSRGRARGLSAAAAAALFLFLAVRPGPSGPDRGFSLEALDIGQGDALLLRWGRRAVLVDGGGPFDLDARDFGRTRLLPKLLDRGVTRLDAAILTHPHPDHALGLFAVLEELPVGAFFRSEGEDEAGLYHDLDATAARRSVPSAALAAGRAVHWADASLTVIHSGGPRWKTDATNNQSLVLLFEREGRRALLTGDAGAATESALLAKGRVPQADALKVGHHGSRGSTTPAFLAAVAPRAALLSCGRENRFGHPAPETLATLAAGRVRVFRTDLLSDVRLELSPASTRLAWRGLP
jgi:competence protein ComEC